MGAFVIGQCQTDLTLVAHALGAASGFPGGLDGWQQKSDEDPDNRQDNEQFHEGKALLVSWELVQTLGGSIGFRHHRNLVVGYLLPDVGCVVFGSLQCSSGSRKGGFPNCFQSI